MLGEGKTFHLAVDRCKLQYNQNVHNGAVTTDLLSYASSFHTMTKQEQIKMVLLHLWVAYDQFIFAFISWSTVCILIYLLRVLLTQRMIQQNVQNTVYMCKKKQQQSSSYRRLFGMATK